MHDLLQGATGEREQATGEKRGDDFRQHRHLHRRFGDGERVRVAQQIRPRPLPDQRQPDGGEDEGEQGKKGEGFAGSHKTGRVRVSGHLHTG